MLEYCSTVWNHYIPARHYLGMTEQVEKVQRYFTRRVYQRCQLDCNYSYLQRLIYLKIESLELHIYDMLDTQLHTDPTENLTTLNILISQAKDKHLPIKLVKFNKHKHKKSNWISIGIIRSITYRDKLYMRLKQVPIDSEMYTHLKTNLKTYQVILKILIRNAKKAYFQKKFDKYKGDIKNTWQTITEILNRTRSPQNLPDAFLIDNEMTGDPSIIADKFNNLFANVGRRLSEQLTTPDNVNFKDYLRIPVVPNMSFSQISEEAVMEVLNNLKQKLSCGHDGISSRLLKASKTVVCKPLTLIINQTLTSGIFPDTLKIAKIIPLFKKGDKTLLENYRPISILPAISKIFERIMFNKIHNHFSMHNLFYSGQYGFRANHSTQFAALELIDRITQDLDQGNMPITIFMDLSKAFDTLNHDILIYKLKSYGLSEAALKLMQSYLTNRKQYVEINNTQSTKNDITVGVPQGSILGPLLFIIYINDIIHSSTVFRFIIFADDTTLYTTLNTQEDINDILNDELVKINNWLKVNKLSLNVAKTKAMLFHMPQKRILNLRLKIAGSNIAFIDNFYFLGITINKHLNWTKHMDILSAKIAKTVGILNTLKHVLPINILKMIYNSLILCHLDYGILLWGAQHNANDKLHKLQKKAIRIITSSNFLAHSEPIFKQLHLLKSYDIYKCQLLKFLFKLVNKQLPTYFNQLPFPFNNQLHHHETRGCKRAFVPRVNHEFSKRNIRYIAAVTYNSTSVSVIAKIYSHSLVGFSTYVKNQTIEHYNNRCTIEHCYSCSQR